MCVVRVHATYSGDIMREWLNYRMPTVGCMTCGRSIAQSAKTCPHCGSTKPHMADLTEDELAAWGWNERKANVRDFILVVVGAVVFVWIAENVWPGIEAELARFAEKMGWR